MNNDLISRSALKEAINTWDKFGYTAKSELVRLTPDNEKSYRPYIFFEDVINCIDNAPTVEPQVVPIANVTFDTEKLKELTDEIVERIKSGEIVLQDERLKGKWIKADNLYDTVVCNKCGGIRRDNRIDHIAFCNKCGADMRGEKE